MVIWRLELTSFKKQIPVPSSFEIKSHEFVGYKLF